MQIRPMRRTLRTSMLSVRAVLEMISRYLGVIGKSEERIHGVNTGILLSLLTKH